MIAPLVCEMIHGFDRLQSRVTSSFYWFWWLVGYAVSRYAGALNRQDGMLTTNTIMKSFLSGSCTFKWNYQFYVDYPTVD